jgi:hypothetical protein
MLSIIGLGKMLLFLEEMNNIDTLDMPEMDGNV